MGKRVEAMHYPQPLLHELLSRLISVYSYKWKYHLFKPSWLKPNRSWLSNGQNRWECARH
jgi:hypothetical protein